MTADVKSKSDVVQEAKEAGTKFHVRESLSFLLSKSSVLDK